MTVRTLVIIATVVLLFIGLAVDNDKLQKVLFVLTAVGIFASLFSPEEIIVFPPETPAISVSPSPATPVSNTLPPETTPSTISPTPTINPQSPYGQAIQKEQLGQASYKEREKASIVTDTYYARKDNNRTRKSWYTSAQFEDEDTGYLIGLYYADGLLFFADACHKGEDPDVTFYFWDDQMFACHDFIGGEDGLSYRGSSVYNRIVSQFGDIYAKSLPYAQYAK